MAPRQKPVASLKRQRKQPDVEDWVYRFLGNLAAMESTNVYKAHPTSKDDNRRGRVGLRRVRSPTPYSWAHVTDRMDSDEEVDEAPPPKNPRGRASKAPAATAADSTDQRTLLQRINHYIRAGIAEGKRRAKRYVRKALSFALETGYLLPADREGKLLRVAPSLVHAVKPVAARKASLAQAERAARPRDSSGRVEARGGRAHGQRARRPSGARSCNGRTRAERNEAAKGEREERRRRSETLAIKRSASCDASNVQPRKSSSAHADGSPMSSNKEATDAAVKPAMRVDSGELDRKPPLSLRRRRRTEADMLYQCLGKLCGEECDQEIVPVTEPGHRSEAMEDAMDAMSDYSGDERDVRETRGNKGGRVAKTKSRKPAPPNHSNEKLLLKLGVQKAKRYVYEALDFGVQSGYLTMKDPKGKVLRVSSDLLHVSETGKAQMPQRIASDGPEPSSGRQERKSNRKRPHHDGAVCDGLCGGEHHDGPAELEDHGKQQQQQQRGVRKHRSRSRQVKKRSATFAAARSRSRSKSIKRRSAPIAVRKKAVAPRSSNRQGNPPPEPRPSKQLKPDSEEQEEMAESQTESRTGSRNDENDEDGKSVKSAKSAKSTLNSDSQNTNEEKKQDDEGSNFEGTDDEDDSNKK